MRKLLRKLSGNYSRSFFAFKAKLIRWLKPQGEETTQETIRKLLKKLLSYTKAVACPSRHRHRYLEIT
jgi:hypothetical protein